MPCAMTILAQRRHPPLELNELPAGGTENSVSANTQQKYTDEVEPSVFITEIRAVTKI